MERRQKGFAISKGATVRDCLNVRRGHMARLACITEGRAYQNEDMAALAFDLLACIKKGHAGSMQTAPLFPRT